MRRRRTIAALGVAGALRPPSRGRAAAPPATADAQDFAQIEHGRYLATAADCAACHTSPDGGKPFAGGRADRDAVRQRSRRPTSRRTARPASAPGATSSSTRRCARASAATARGSIRRCRITSYTKMSRDDVLAIRAYLDTVPAGAQSGRRQHAAVSVQHPRRDARLGLRSISSRASSSPIRTNRPNGIAARSWCTGPAIAAPATRRRPFSAATRPANTCTARVLQGWFAPDITNDNARGPRPLVGRRYRRAYLKTGHNRDHRRDRADGGGGRACRARR